MPRRKDTPLAAQASKAGKVIPGDAWNPPARYPTPLSHLVETRQLDANAAEDGHARTSTRALASPGRTSRWPPSAANPRTFHRSGPPRRHTLGTIVEPVTVHPRDVRLKPITVDARPLTEAVAAFTPDKRTDGKTDSRQDGHPRRPDVTS